LGEKILTAFVTLHATFKAETSRVRSLTRAHEVQAENPPWWWSIGLVSFTSRDRIHSGSFVSSLEQATNLLCAQANSSGFEKGNE